jgi:hypothetical protein
VWASAHVLESGNAKANAIIVSLMFLSFVPFTQTAIGLSI